MDVTKEELRERLRQGKIYAPQQAERALSSFFTYENLSFLRELCLPVVKVGGRFLSMKSVDSDQELDQAAHAIKLLGGRVRDVKDYAIPGADVTHRLVIVEKVAPTLKGYPRRWAKIQKAPL